MSHCPRTRKRPVIEGHSTIRMNCSLINSIVVILIFVSGLPGASAEIEKHFKVSESAPLGHKIGHVSDQIPSSLDKSNFYIVFPESDSMAEKVS